MSDKLISLNSKSTLSKLENKVATTTRLINIINIDRLVNLLTKENEFFLEFILTNCNLSYSTLLLIDSIYPITNNIFLKDTIKIGDPKKSKALFIEKKFINHINFKIWENHYFDNFISVLQKTDIQKTILVNAYFPLSANLIENLNEKIIWIGISNNPNLEWDRELIERFNNKWDWEVLSRSEHLPWSEDLIDQFLNKWNWYSLTLNSAINWTEKLIDKYLPFLKEETWCNLVSYTKITWSEKLIERYHKYIFDIYTPFYDSNKMYYNAFECLTARSNMLWTVKMLEKYEKVFDDNYCWSGYHGSLLFHTGGLSINPFLPWNELLIDRFIDKWDWGFLQLNSGISWDEKLIKRYNKHIFFPIFIGNVDFVWTVEYVEQAIEELHNHKNSVQYERFYKQYDYNINEKSNSRDYDTMFILYRIVALNKNPKTWTYSLLKYFFEISMTDKLLVGYLSKNGLITWSLKFIKEFESVLSFNNLSRNNSIPWTLDLFLEYADKWNYDYLLQNETFIESMTPYFNNKLIEKVLSKLISNENTSVF